MTMTSDTDERQIVDVAAVVRREKLTGSSGPSALVKNRKAFQTGLIACIGGCVFFLTSLLVLPVREVLLTGL